MKEDCQVSGLLRSETIELSGSEHCLALQERGRMTYKVIGRLAELLLPLWTQRAQVKEVRQLSVSSSVVEGRALS